MRYLEKLADHRWSLGFVAGLGILWGLLTAGLYLFLGPAIRAECTKKTLDSMMRFYTEEEAYEMIKSCTDKGRKIYFWAEVFDFVVYPVVLALASALGIVLASRNLWGRGTRVKWLATVPMVYLLTDWSENISIMTMIVSYPERRYALGTFAGVITPIKWFVGGVSGALAIGLLSRWGLRSIFARGKG